MGDMSDYHDDPERWIDEATLDETGPSPTLAWLMIDELNGLIADPAIKETISHIIRMRLEVPPGERAQALLNHETIQVYSIGNPNDEAGMGALFGILGVLNGIAGVNPDGTGKIGAQYSVEGELMYFFHFDGGDSDDENVVEI